MSPRRSGVMNFFRLGRDLVYLWKNHVLLLRRTQGGWQFVLELKDRIVALEGLHLEGLIESIHTTARLLREQDAPETQEPGFRFPHRHTGWDPEEED